MTHQQMYYNLQSFRQNFLHSKITEAQRESGKYPSSKQDFYYGDAS